MTHPLLLTIAAALEGLASIATTNAHDAAFTLVALTTLGDALRAQVPQPRELKRWLRSCREDALSHAVNTLRSERETWTLPASHSEDPMLPFVLRRRDEVESARAALEWRAIGCAPGAELKTALAALDRALTDFDEALAAVFSLAEVEQMLGARVALDDRGWRQRLRHTAEEREVVSAEHDLSAEPSSEVIDLWLRRGKLFRYVQQYAAQHTDFAEKLKELVEHALHDAREDRSLPVGFVAHRWLQLQTGRSERLVVPVYAVPARRLAAASAVEDAPSEKVSLGLLAPLKAHGEIQCDGVRATLRVDAEVGAVSGVQFGHEEAPTPPPGQPWRVTIPFQSEPVAVIVRAPDGAMISFDLELLVPADASRS